MSATPAYADIASQVARIVWTSGNQAAGKYLEGIMEEEFEKIRKEMKESEDRIKKHFDVSLERLQELAGNSPKK